jgi:hypothetical protein
MPLNFEVGVFNSLINEFVPNVTVNWVSTDSTVVMKGSAYAGSGSGASTVNVGTESVTAAKSVRITFMTDGANSWTSAPIMVTPPETAPPPVEEEFTRELRLVSRPTTTAAGSPVVLSLVLLSTDGSLAPIPLTETLEVLWESSDRDFIDHGRNASVAFVATGVDLSITTTDREGVIDEDDDDATVTVSITLSVEDAPDYVVDVKLTDANDN